MAAKPSHIVFSVVQPKEGSGRSAKWIEIGAAWAHDDGKGYNLILNAFPINGQLSLRVNEPKPRDEE